MAVTPGRKTVKKIGYCDGNQANMAVVAAGLKPVRRSEINLEIGPLSTQKAVMLVAAQQRTPTKPPVRTTPQPRTTANSP